MTAVRPVCFLALATIARRTAIESWNAEARLDAERPDDNHVQKGIAKMPIRDRRAALDPDMPDSIPEKVRKSEAQSRARLQTH